MTNMISEKRNILYISSYSYLKGGGQQSLYYLIKNINKALFNVHAIFPERGGFLDIIEALGVQVSVIPMDKIKLSRCRAMLAVVKSLTSYIKNNNIALIHTDAPRSTFYAGLSSLITNTPLVWHIRASNSEGLWDSILVTLSANLILTSESQRRERFHAVNNQEKLTVIYNGVDLDEYRDDQKLDGPLRRELSIGNDCILIGVIGRVEELKGQEYLIMALSLINAAAGDYRVIIVGEPEKRYCDYLNGLISRKGLSKKVLFLGQRQGIKDILTEVDILVHPSLFEAFPRVILEAMACGKPVIATNTGGVSESVKDTITGYLIMPKDISSLGKRLEELIKSKEKRIKMGALGRRRAEKLFSIQKNVQSTESLYTRVFLENRREFGDYRPVRFRKYAYLAITRQLYKGFYLMLNKKGATRDFNINRCRSILIVFFDRIGDLVLALPFFESVRAGFPNASISVLINSYSRDILLDNKNIDHLIVMEKDSSIINGLNRKIKDIKAIKGRKIDLFIDLTMDHTIKCPFLTLFLRPEFSIGYNTNSRGFLYNKVINPPNTVTHQKDLYLRILKCLNMPLTSNLPKITVSDKRKENGLELINKCLPLKRERPVVGVCPAAFYESQCWTEESFAAACDQISNKLDVSIVLVGGPRDIKKINRIKSLVTIKDLIAINNLKLKDSMDLLSICSVVLSNNSGLLHIAAAMDIPTVSLMGPTLPGRWWPLGKYNTVIRKDVNCSPCNKGFCPSHECMNLITVNEVVAAVCNVLSSSASKIERHNVAVNNP